MPLMKGISIKSPLHFAVQKWWLIYGLSLALFFLWIVIAIWGPPTPKPADDTVFYPWILFQGRAAILALVALAGFALGCLFYAVKNRSFAVPLILAAITLCSWFSILWWIGPLVGTISNSFEPDPTLTHIDSLKTSGHVYNLAVYEALSQVTGWLGPRYVLYECDGLGLNCFATYRYTPQSLEEEHPDGEHPPSISFDGANISIHIAGKVVYVHPISIHNP
jgi:hypothetical protein